MARPCEKPNVLITGAAGFVGRRTLERLARSRQRVGTVVAFDLRDTPADQRLGGVNYVSGDIRNADLATLMREHAIDTVVHLAFILRTPRGLPQLAYEVDVGGTQNVLDACIDTGVGKLIVISSGAAYGYHPDNPPALTEDDAIRGNPEFPYSHHKRLVEELLADYRQRHPELRQLIFRAGTILGEGASSPITDLFDKPVMLGVAGSDAPFNFIWDEDVAACLVAGIFEQRVGVYNLAGDGVLSTREIAHRLGKPYVPIPAPVLTGALWILQRLRLTQYGPEQVRFLRHRPVLDNARLKTEFGYEPRLVSREVFDLYAGSRHA